MRLAYRVDKPAREVGGQHVDIPHRNEHVRLFDVKCKALGLIVSVDIELIRADIFHVLNPADQRLGRECEDLFWCRGVSTKFVSPVGLLTCVEHFETTYGDARARR